MKKLVILQTQSKFLAAKHDQNRELPRCARIFTNLQCSPECKMWAKPQPLDVWTHPPKGQWWKFSWLCFLHCCCVHKFCASVVYPGDSTNISTVKWTEGIFAATFHQEVTIIQTINDSVHFIMSNCTLPVCSQPEIIMHALRRHRYWRFTALVQRRSLPAVWRVYTLSM